VTGPDNSPSKGLLLGVLLGAPLIGLALLDGRTDAADTHPAELTRWIVGGVLVVDLVVIPGALLVARATRRWRWLRWPLAATGTILLVAWPFVRGYGRSASNGSLLPRDYAVGTLVAVAVVWATAALVTLARRRTAKPSPVAPLPPEGR
jgi:hypothetical protein